MISGLILGIILGFIVTIPPLGPTYFQIIQQGLKNQIKNGIAIGAGAGLVDMIYILVSFGGVALIASLLPDSILNYFSNNSDLLKLILALCGSLFVIIYGLKIIFTKQDFSLHLADPEKPELIEKIEKVEKVFKKTESRIDKLLRTKVLEKHHSNITMSFIAGIVSCLSSPTLPASWFAIVSYLKSYGLIDSNFITGLFLAIGVFMGATFWFYLLVKFVSKNSLKINPATLKILNNVMGMLLVIIGVSILIKLYFSGI